MAFSFSHLLKFSLKSLKKSDFFKNKNELEHAAAVCLHCSATGSALQLLRVAPVSIPNLNKSRIRNLTKYTQNHYFWLLFCYLFTYFQYWQFFGNFLAIFAFFCYFSYFSQLLFCCFSQLLFCYFCYVSTILLPFCHFSSISCYFYAIFPLIFIGHLFCNFYAIFCYFYATFLLL